MMLYICTKFHEDISKGHKIMMDGQTDRQMDKVVSIGLPPTSSGGAPEIFRWFYASFVGI